MTELTAKQINLIQDKLDVWTYPSNAPQILNKQLNMITFVRVVKNNNQNYTILRAWWTGDDVAVSCDEQSKTAKIILERLCKILED